MKMEDVKVGQVLLVKSKSKNNLIEARILDITPFFNIKIQPPYNQAIPVRDIPMPYWIALEDYIIVEDITDLNK